MREPLRSIEEIVEKLTPSQKADFFDKFWTTWSVNGFGTLTKKDTELLIFGCLNQALGSTAPGNNYGWATLLRLTPSKIKAMRLETHLRFGHLMRDSNVKEISQFLENFTNLQSIDVSGLTASGDLMDVTVSFVIEDPVIQMELENYLKEIGTYLDFHRNREVVKLRLVDFFKIATTEAERKIIDRWVTAKAKEKNEAGELKLRVVAKEYADKSEVGKLKAFCGDLADFAKVDKLTDHLKLIFVSQKER